jgi:hypothetical protein
MSRFNELELGVQISRIATPIAEGSKLLGTTIFIRISLASL